MKMKELAFVPRLGVPGWAVVVSKPTAMAPQPPGLIPHTEPPGYGRPPGVGVFERHPARYVLNT